MKPFLKWAGNKFRLLELIKTVLPPGNRLIEPFVGSGAVFLNTHYSEYLLNDLNADLILLYKVLQKNGPSFIDFCSTFFIAENNNRESFNSLREQFKTTSNLELKAALFVYLNRYSFNGLCRYNIKGEFNTPFGKHKKPYFPAKEMYFFYQKTQHVTFQQGNFINIMLNASEGDVIYCDPPYVPLSRTSNFTSYNPNVFGKEQQITLMNLAKQLANKNIPVIISNHHTNFTQEIYNDAKVFIFDVQRYISRDGSKRTKAKEMLAVFA